MAISKSAALKKVELLHKIGTIPYADKTKYYALSRAGKQTIHLTKLSLRGPIIFGVDLLGRKHEVVKTEITGFSVLYAKKVKELKRIITEITELEDEQFKLGVKIESLRKKI